MVKENILVVSGKRKTAIAKAKIKTGTGKISVNKQNIQNFGFFRGMRLEEPLTIAHQVLGDFNFDISVTVVGGGKQGQNDAARLAIAKSIVAFTKNSELKKAYSDYDKTLLVADTRRKETRKPNDSKARAKRQKSFR